MISDQVLKDAAGDTIVALREENARLREALREIDIAAGQIIDATQIHGGASITIPTCRAIRSRIAALFHPGKPPGG
jgi:hypothetical protein